MSNKYFRSVSSLLLAAIMLVGSIPQYSSYAESTSNHMNVVQAQSGEEMVQNQFQTDMYLASIKPEFIQTMNGTVSNREARRVHPGETQDEAIASVKGQT